MLSSLYRIKIRQHPPTSGSFAHQLPRNKSVQVSMAWYGPLRRPYFPHNLALSIVTECNRSSHVRHPKPTMSSPLGRPYRLISAPTCCAYSIEEFGKHGRYPGQRMSGTSARWSFIRSGTQRRYEWEVRARRAPPVRDRSRAWHALQRDLLVRKIYGNLFCSPSFTRSS